MAELSHTHTHEDHHSQLIKVKVDVKGTPPPRHERYWRAASIHYQHKNRAIHRTVAPPEAATSFQKLASHRSWSKNNLFCRQIGSGSDTDFPIAVEVGLT